MAWKSTCSCCLVFFLLKLKKKHSINYLSTPNHFVVKVARSAEIYQTKTTKQYNGDQTNGASHVRCRLVWFFKIFRKRNKRSLVGIQKKLEVLRDWLISQIYWTWNSMQLAELEWDYEEIWYSYCGISHITIGRVGIHRMTAESYRVQTL